MKATVTVTYEVDVSDFSQPFPTVPENDLFKYVHNSMLLQKIEGADGKEIRISDIALGLYDPRGNKLTAVNEKRG